MQITEVDFNDIVIIWRKTKYKVYNGKNIKSKTTAIAITLTRMLPSYDTLLHTNK